MTLLEVTGGSYTKRAHILLLCCPDAQDRQVLEVAEWSSEAGKGRKNEDHWLTGTGFLAEAENIMGSDNGQDHVMNEYTSSTC